MCGNKHQSGWCGKVSDAVRCTEEITQGSRGSEGFLKTLYFKEKTAGKEIKYGKNNCKMTVWGTVPRTLYRKDSKKEEKYLAKFLPSTVPPNLERGQNGFRTGSERVQNALQNTFQTRSRSPLAATGTRNP